MKELVHMNEASVVPLANAIVANAARDYMSAVVQDDARYILENERFFDSDWCDFLCGEIDSHNLAMNIKKKVRQYARKMDEHQPQQWYSPKDNSEEAKAEKDKCSFTCPICRGKVEIYFAKSRRKILRKTLSGISYTDTDEKKVIYHCLNCHFEATSLFPIGRVKKHICYNCIHCTKKNEQYRCQMNRNKSVNYDEHCADWEYINGETY